MNRRKLIWSASLALAGVLATVPHETQAQARRVTPERRLLGISLGRDQLDVIRRFGRPSKVQTVALAVSQDTLPGLGGGGAAGMDAGGSPFGGGGYPGAGGAPFGGGGYPGAGGGSPFGGGYPGAGGAPFGGGGYPGAGGGSPFGGPTGGGIPTLPPGMEGGGYPGAGGGYPGGGAPGGMFGAPGLGGGANVPEYSTAILWIYERPNDVRLEFLINEDGRVAQISVAAPAGKTFPGVRTARGISLGTDFTRVIEAYGNPERHRLLPGLRFYETYYTKNYHAAFTFDTQPKNKKDEMKVVRITIALAED